ncbi:MAG: polysaccharide biosynthesis C-terminal domain-containing protein [Eubacteriales bacterium]|nr:polysaccharide biosynthesis C-terminal domain-containing protein [Eubacteriales bacterium]
MSDIKLSDHFTYPRLLRFIMPTVAMMVFSSVYGIADGYFVSNYAGKTAFSGINIIMPYIMIIASLGFVFGTGGSALVGKTLGEGKKEKASELFSMFVYVTIITGVVIAVAGAVSMDKVAYLCGARGELKALAARYGRISMVSITAFMLQMEFQSFFITAEKPRMGFLMTLMSGVINILMDFILVGKLGLGLDGAAWATVMSELAGGLVPVVYFALKKDLPIRLTVFRFDSRSLIQGIYNGMSEFIGSITASFVSILYNFQLLKFAGENGVAAYGVMMYVEMIFMSLFFGYCMGTAPIISFNYGANDKEEMRNVYTKSLTVIGLTSALMCASSLGMAKSLSELYVGYDRGLYELTLRGFRIYSFVYLFSGIGCFGSSFFTALNNGLISAILSVMRTVVFQIIMVLTLPGLLGIDGIWLSLPSAELASALLSAAMLIVFGERYGYRTKKELKK